MPTLLPKNKARTATRVTRSRRPQTAKGSPSVRGTANGQHASESPVALLETAGLVSWRAQGTSLKQVTLSPDQPRFLTDCTALDHNAESSWFDGIHSIDLRRVEAFFKALPTATLPAKVEYRLVRAAGSPVWVRHWILSSRAGVLSGGLQDVTELKAAHAENLDVSEREQNRIGQDLHDDLCQVLAGLSCLTRVVERQLVDRAPEEAKALHDINQQLVEAMDRTRALTHGLFPARLKNGDVRGALQELAHQIKIRFSVETHLEFKGAFPQHEHLQIIQVYRLAQEAVSNSVKHGRAKNVHIDLRRQGDRMVLVIQDDGTGFPATRNNQEGIGLHIMRHRAALLGGELTLGNGPRGGARVALTYSTPSAHEKN